MLAFIVIRSSQIPTACSSFEGSVDSSLLREKTNEWIDPAASASPLYADVRRPGFYQFAASSDGIESPLTLLSGMWRLNHGVSNGRTWARASPAVGTVGRCAC
jgi:hypothetical protein